MPNPDPNHNPIDLHLSLLPATITMDPDSAGLATIRMVDYHAAMSGHDTPTPLGVSTVVFLTRPQAIELLAGIESWLRTSTPQPKPQSQDQI